MNPKRGAVVLVGLVVVAGWVLWDQHEDGVVLRAAADSGLAYELALCGGSAYERTVRRMEYDDAMRAARARRGYEDVELNRIDNSVQNTQALCKAF